MLIPLFAHLYIVNLVIVSISSSFPFISLNYIGVRGNRWQIGTLYDYVLATTLLKTYWFFVISVKYVNSHAISNVWPPKERASVLIQLHNFLWLLLIIRGPANLLFVLIRPDLNNAKLHTSYLTSNVYVNSSKLDDV